MIKHFALFLCSTVVIVGIKHFSTTRQVTEYFLHGFQAAYICLLQSCLAYIAKHIEYGLVPDHFVVQEKLENLGANIM